MQLSLVCILAVAFTAQATRWFELKDYTFEKYIKEFNKEYPVEEYETRKQLFETRLTAIRAHNSNPTFTWKEGVNRLTDRTDQEFRRLLGYDMKKKFAYADAVAQYRLPAAAELHQTASELDLPSSVDWRNESVITAVKDQGQCGSCWTFGTTESIESFYALKFGAKELPVLSEQEILDCTPNPNDCGGTGGCGGGTPELAMAQLIKLGGQTTEKLYPYVSGGGNDYKCHFSNKTTPPLAHMSGYTVLPSNVYLPVLTAVATLGPLIINVDASSWSSYESGVFNGCNQVNPDIDHVVQLVGYGTDSSAGDYWLVRNSWSASWGEEGYIRLLRSSTLNCGIDQNPQDGTGCNGGPPTVRVCGTCGILYDVSYPVISTSA